MADGLLVGLVALVALAASRRGRPPTTGASSAPSGPASGGVEVVSTAAGWWVVGRASALGLRLGGDAPQPPAGGAICSGPMFDGRGLRFAFFDAARGVNVPSRNPGDGQTLAVVGGVARAARGGAIPAGAQVAVQGYPSLVEGGRPVDCQEGERGRRRLAWAVMDGGRVALVGVVGTMWALRAELVRGGAQAAAYLDGGGASQFRAAGGRPDWRHEDRERPAGWVLLGG